MCRTIYRNLNPGGRLVAATLNPNVTEVDLPVYEQYGVKLTPPEGLHDGAQVTATLTIAAGTLELSAYYWSLDTYQRALAQAGFREIKWRPMQVSEAGLAAYGQTYLAALFSQAG